MTNLREARKSEADETTRREIERVWMEDYGCQKCAIKWEKGSRQYRQQGFWYIELTDEDGDTYVAGSLMVCDECGEVYPVLPGNVYRKIGAKAPSFSCGDEAPPL